MYQKCTIYNLVYVQFCEREKCNATKKINTLLVSVTIMESYITTQGTIMEID